MTLMIQHPKLTEIQNVQHGFLTRCGGVSQGSFASNNCNLGKGDLDSNTISNRQTSIARLGLGDTHLHFVKQAHTTRVVIVDSPSQALGEADGMITTSREVSLGILTADCCPMLMATRDGQIVGAIHAGWRGTAKGIVETSIAAMVALGAAPCDIVAVIGPAIAATSYEVKDDVRDVFLKLNHSYDRYFHPYPQADSFFFDLPGLVLSNLKSHGVSNSYIVDMDTYAHENLFYSFRRKTHRHEAHMGNQMSVIAKR